MQNAEVTHEEIFFLEAFVCWRHQHAQWNMKQARAIEFDYTNLLAML